MSDNNNININTPDIGPYTHLQPFRFWCQKVLPLVYDESLSYYELLCKVVDYLNKTMEDVDQMITDMGEFKTADTEFKTEVSQAVEGLETFVNNYFNNLNVQTEINNKLDAMAEAGYFDTLFATLFTTDIINEAGEVTSSWIAANLLQETGYVIDKSLTVDNAAADAKATGDRINLEYKFGKAGYVETIIIPDSDYQNGYYQNQSSSGTLDITDKVADSNMSNVQFEVKEGDHVILTTDGKSGSGRRAYAFTNKNYNIYRGSATATAYTNEDLFVYNDGYASFNVKNDSFYQIVHIKNQLYKNTNLTDQFKSFRDNPNLINCWLPMKQGEFGGWSNVTYARRTWGPVNLPFDFDLYTPGDYQIVLYTENTRRLLDNFVHCSANTNYAIAIKIRSETGTLTEEEAKANLFFSFPVYLENYKTTFSGAGIFGKFGVIGDSYACGSMHWDSDGHQDYKLTYSWEALLCKRNGCDLSVYAHGGYGINRFITELLPELLADDPQNLYWWGLGINDAEDARDPAKLGSIDDLSSGDYTQYPNTLYGNYGKAYEIVAAHAPLAKHIFASCIKNDVNHRWTSYKAINTLLQEIAEHYGVPFIDLVDDPFYRSRFYNDQMKTDHPTLIGYQGMSYANDRLIGKCITENVDYFKDYGRTS